MRVWRNGSREGFKNLFRKESRFESEYPHQFKIDNWRNSSIIYYLGVSPMTLEVKNNLSEEDYKTKEIIKNTIPRRLCKKCGNNLPTML